MAADIVSSVLRVVATAVLARLLVPGDFGLLSMVTAISVFAERFKDLGLSDATVQSKEITHVQVSGLFWVNLLVCLAIAVVLASLSPLIALFYGEPRLISISLVVASTFVFSGFVIQHQGLLRRQLRFGVLATINLSSMVLSLVVAIVLAYHGFGYWALVAREFARALFVFVGTWIACPWRPGPFRRNSGISPLLSFGRNVTAFNVVTFLANSVDRILIGKLHGASWLGLYDNAHRLLALPIQQIRHPVNTVALPTLSALQTQADKFGSFYTKATQLMVFVATPVVAFVLVFADVVVAILLGPQWIQSVLLVRIMAIGLLVEPFVQLVGPALVANAKTREYLRLGVINSVVFIVLVFAGGFVWGPMGVALAWAASCLLAVPVGVACGLRYLPVVGRELFVKLTADFLVVIFWGALIAAARYALGWPQTPLWLFGFAAGGFVAYFALWYFVPGGKERLLLYRGYVGRIFGSKKGPKEPSKG